MTDISAGVSVVIPCYNGKDAVAASIESALAQDSCSEVIVVDDGSTDGTLAVLQNFGSRIRWVTGPNRGANAARNRGLGMAGGDFIQFLDADNILLPEKFKLSLPPLQSGEADLVFADEEPVDASGSPLPAVPPLDWTGGDPIPMLLQLRPPVQTTAALHRRRLLEEIGGFDETLPCCQDFDLHLRLAAAGVTFCHVPRVLSRFRRSPGSISSDYRRVLLQHEFIVARAVGLLAKQDGMTDARQRAFAELLARDARSLYRLGEREAASRYANRAIQIHPATKGLSAFSASYQLLARLVGLMRAESLLSVCRFTEGTG